MPWLGLSYTSPGGSSLSSSRGRPPGIKILSLECHRTPYWGALLFCVCTLPLGDTVRRHDSEIHLYADDCQLLLAFDPTQSRSALGVLETGIAEVRAWLACNFLELNDVNLCSWPSEPGRSLPRQMSHPSPLVRKASRFHPKRITLVLLLTLSLVSSLTCLLYVARCSIIYGALGRSGSIWTREQLRLPF